MQCISEVLQLNSTTEHHTNRYVSIFSGSSDAGTEEFLSWKQSLKPLLW